MNFSYIILGVVGVILVIVLVLWIIARLKGKLVIQLDKYAFSSGETIKGKVILKLRKPVHAKALYVELVGESKTTSYNPTNSGISNTSNSARVYEFKLPISGEKDYASEEGYDFELKAPQFSSSSNKNITINLKNPSSMFSGNNSVVNWHIRSGLDVPGIDVSGKVNIQIA